MRFLLVANMPRSAAGAVQRLGHEAFDVREVGLGGAEDKQIAAYAKEHGLALIIHGKDTGSQIQCRDAIPRVVMCPHRSGANRGANAALASCFLAAIGH